jgi:hypothetical protein
MMSLYCLWVSLMLRTYSRIIALIGMVAASAQAADETLTLACKGRETSSGKGPKTSEVIDIGIIVDFQKKIVTGFFDSPSPPLKIDSLTETAISFSGKEVDNKGLIWSMNGTLDRITGSLIAAWEGFNLTISYDLKCRPTQRMF